MLLLIQVRGRQRGAGRGAVRVVPRALHSERGWQAKLLFWPAAGLSAQYQHFRPFGTVVPISDIKSERTDTKPCKRHSQDIVLRVDLRHLHCQQALFFFILSMKYISLLAGEMSQRL